MAPSSVSSDIFFGVALLLICIAVLLVLRYYIPLRSTPAFLIIPVFLSLSLPSSIILLVPIDLASNSGEAEGSTRGVWLPDGFMLIVWRVTYWLTFVLTWFVLPLLGEYVDSGHREPKQRMIYSLRSNARYYALVVTFGIAGLVYFIVRTGFHLTSLKSLVMALAYVWGLILAISLMGHGLVVIPRNLWKSRDIGHQLKTIQALAPKIHGRLTDSIDVLHDLESQVAQLQQRKTGSAVAFRDWIAELSEPSYLPRPRMQPYKPQPSSTAVPNVVTEGYLADLTRKLRRARHQKGRFATEWNDLVARSEDLQAILDAATHRRLVWGENHQRTILSNTVGRLFTPSLRYQVYGNLYPLICMAGAIVLGICSLCIVWSEIFKSLVPKLSVIGISIVHHPKSDNGKIGFAGQLIAGFWLLYMCTATLSSMQHVKVWGNRALVRRHTYAESACWYAMQVAKLTVPLAYDFILLLPANIHQNTTFYKFLGQLIDFTPLGAWFSTLFPIFILVPVLATLFNLFGRLKRIAGFGLIDDDDDDQSSAYGTGSPREGRALIQHETQDTHDSVGLDAAEPRIVVDEENPWASEEPFSDEPSQVQTFSARPPVEPTSSRSKPRPPPPEDDDNLFEIFAHRVRNTFETADFKFQKPKWMANIGNNNNSNNVNANANGSSSSTEGPDGIAQGFRNFFGNRSNDGRLRL